MTPESGSRRAEHLDEDEVHRLHEGVLRGDERTGIESHLDSCESCRRLVGATAPTETTPMVGADGAGITVVALPDGETGVLGRGASIGRYLVLSPLGQGGMGTVYAAYDPELDRRVAIKLLHTAHGSERGRALCMREARTLGKLSHPNVVQVHDVGEHEGDVFLAMELVDGRSLDAWCRLPPRPGFREILATYLEAARGISAAHAKGIVHRDIKPSNILRGEDGRVRVADFGLASIVELEQGGDGAASVEATPSSADARLTTTGALLGTPLYMAPEQHESPRMTAASDQYSFCVALYEALYGAAPFTPEARGRGQAFLAGLLAQKKKGLSPSPPASSDVPAWVYEALARGLSPDPANRYPSMDALIAALRDDRDARRRARWQRAGAGAIAAALIAVAAAGWVRRGSAPSDRCAHPEQQLAGVWDDGAKGAVRAAFAGTGLPYAEATTTRVLALLDRYASAYGSMRVEVCEAGRTGTQPAAVVGLREACLERRLAQLHALTALFAEKPDTKVLDRAVDAASGLYPVDYCADTDALTARLPPPEDPQLRARVAALEPSVDRLEALYAAGKYKEGLEAGDALLSEAGTIAYAPLRARMHYWTGMLQLAGTGDDAGAKARFLEAAVSASEGRDDLLAAHAWIRFLYVLIDRQRRLEEASTVHALGRAVMARVRDPVTQAQWANIDGLLLGRLGKHAEAKAAYERAQAIREKVLGPDHPEVASSLNNVARELCDMGNCRAAEPLLERAVAISERAQGPDHPDTALSLNNLGIVLRRLGEYPRALATQERALAVRERALGPNQAPLAATLTNLGNVLLDMGDLPRAEAVLERALALKERAKGPDHPDLASTLFSLGRTKVALGQLDAALPLLEKSRALYEKNKGGHADLAEPLLGLGELSLARGRPAEAVPILEKAASLGNADRSAEIDLTLAEALFRVGKDRARARALAEGARATYERMEHRPGMERASRWLAEHPG